MTKQQLIKLKNQITLGSQHTYDYINSYNIPPEQVKDFFDNWLHQKRISDIYEYYEYCCEELEEDALSEIYYTQYYSNNRLI